MASKPLVYVAGPISADPIGSARKAIDNYMEMIQAGQVIPFCPHLSVLAEIMRGPTDYEMWMAHDFEIIDRCDALLCIGESPGADREVEHARKQDIPVFFNTWGLYEWARWQQNPRPVAAVRVLPIRRVVPNPLHSVDL